jgi:hypothetical protein
VESPKPTPIRRHPNRRQQEINRPPSSRECRLRHFTGRRVHHLVVGTLRRPAPLLERPDGVSSCICVTSPKRLIRTSAGSPIRDSSTVLPPSATVNAQYPRRGHHRASLRKRDTTTAGDGDPVVRAGPRTRPLWVGEASYVDVEGPAPCDAQWSGSRTIAAQPTKWVTWRVADLSQSEARP